MTKRKIIKEYVPVYYDADTGEVIDNLSFQEKQQIDDEYDTKFCKVFSNIVDLAKSSLSMRKSTFALMLYIISNMSFGNKFYYKRNLIARALGISPSALSISIQELVKYNFCIPVGNDKLWVVNPSYAFCGNNATAVQRWYNKLQNDASKEKVKTYSQKVKSEIIPPVKQTEFAMVASKKYGHNKKVAIVNYLLKAADTQHVVHKQVNQMVQDLGITKATVIPTLKLLAAEGYIHRPCRGVVQLLKPYELEQLLC